jgi:LCP family protein required for cell wall assembly
MSGHPRADSVEPAPSRGERWRQRLAFALALLLLAIGTLYAALAIAVRVDEIFFPGNGLSLPGPLARVPGLTSTPADSSPLTDRINILILGLDRRPHHAPNADGPPRSDSIYVLSVDPLTKTGGVLAIPRDLYVAMPSPTGRGPAWLTRINTAYHYGVVYKYPGGGPALARETVEQTLKIKINYYIVLDWVAFADVIDALGGIELTVPAPLRRVEGYNPRDGNAFLIDIPAGHQPMDSITALAYSRYRGDPEGDLARIRRQQQVMQAAMDKALSLGWLASAPTLWSRFRGSFDTDISTARLPGLIALARQIGPERLVMVSLAGERGEAVRAMRTAAGEDVLMPIWERAVPIIQSVIYDRRLREEGAHVKILNGTPTRGQATRAAAVLTRNGLAPADVQAADTEPAERRQETVVIDYSGKDYTARRIQEWLNLPRAAVQRVTAAARGPNDPDIVVILGQDLKLPVDVALTAFDVQ